MEFNSGLAVCLIGYFLAIFFSGIGLIYGAILYIFKKDNETYYEHSRNIIAVAIIIIILRLFAHFGSLIISSIF